jgi:hypothetical protein
MNEFVKLLTEAVNNRDQPYAMDYSVLLTRLRKMKMVYMIIILNQLSSVFLIILVRIFLGSFPFVWVLLFVGLTIALAVPIGITYLFPEFDKTSTDEKKLSKRAIVVSGTRTEISIDETPSKVSSFV